MDRSIDWTSKVPTNKQIDWTSYIRMCLWSCETNSSPAI